MLSDAQIDDLHEDLAEEAWSEEEVSSLYQLQQRCRASSASEVGRRLQVAARIDACVAATEICGLVHADIEQDWEAALWALEQELRDLRHERRQRHVGDVPQPLTAALIEQLNQCDQEAEQILLERINAAIRRWNDRIAAGDPLNTTGHHSPPPEDTSMKTKAAKRSSRRRREVRAWYDPHGELRWECPQCRTEHPETTRACGCEFVRPLTKHLIATATAEAAEQPPEAAGELRIGPDYRSDPPELLPDTPQWDEQRRAQLEALAATYSADILPRIRKPVQIDGRLFVCTGRVSSAADGILSINCWEVVPAAAYSGRPRSWEELQREHAAASARDLEGAASDAEQVEVQGYYDRLLVTCGSAAYVLVGPQHELDGEGIGAVEPKPAGKTRRRASALDTGPSTLDSVPETQAEAQAKAERLTAEDAESAEGETIVLEFTSAARCEASITLRRSAVDVDVWFDRIDQSTSWQEGRPRASTEALCEHFPGGQTTRSHALACALRRLRERWEGVDDQVLTPQGRKARRLALRQLATARRRLLGEWRGPRELVDRHRPAVAVEDQRGEKVSDDAGPAARPAPDPMPRAVPVSLIRWREDNPRGPATGEEIARKASTLEREGQLAPIGVRALADGTLEGWWGERRFRAAVLLRWELLQAVVFPPETPDLVLRGKRAAENLDQEDLDPIARARHLQERLLALGWQPAGGGRSLRSLAAEVGVSQGEISTTLGLLRLPDDWQQRLIAQEITPTQARSLLPWVDRPAVLQAIAAALCSDRKVGPAAERFTAVEFACEVQDLILEISRPAEPKEYIDCKRGSVRFTEALLEQHAAELDLATVEVRNRWSGAAEKQRRAFNVAAWERLHTPLEEAAREREEKRAARAGGASAKGETATPEQLAARKRAQREQLARRVREYRADWLRRAIADRLADAAGNHRCTDEQLLTLLVYLACWTGQRADQAVARAVRDAGGRVKRAGCGADSCDPWATLVSLPPRGRSDRTLPHVAAAIAADWIRGGQAPAADLPAIATHLGIDLAAEWRVDEPFLRLFQRAPLLALVREWKLAPGFAGRPLEKRGDLIVALLEADQRQRLPAPKILTAGR